jgi:hypothetical protein
MNTLEIDLTDRQDGASLLSVAPPPSSLALLQKETQTILLRMFRDPRVLEKERRKATLPI